MIFSEHEKDAMRRGEPVDVGARRYAQCPVCKSAVRVNGWFGGVHLCLTSEAAQAVRDGRAIVVETW